MKQVGTKQIDKVIAQAQEIAARDNYASHEPTARNHAELQALQIQVNGELIKTIRGLDAKNAKLQRLLFWLSLIATASALIALFR
jgi:hypothetical protein